MLFTLPSFKIELCLLRLLGFPILDDNNSPFLGFLGELLLLLLGLEPDRSFLGLDDRLKGFALAPGSSSPGPCFLLTFLVAASVGSDFFLVFFGDEPFRSFCLPFSTATAAVTVLLTFGNGIYCLVFTRCYRSSLCLTKGSRYVLSLNKGVNAIMSLLGLGAHHTQDGLLSIAHSTYIESICL